jgi:hypothetical protein
MAKKDVIKKSSKEVVEDDNKLLNVMKEINKGFKVLRKKQWRKNKEINISDHRPLVLECSPTKLLSEF